MDGVMVGCAKRIDKSCTLLHKRINRGLFASFQSISIPAVGCVDCDGTGSTGVKSKKNCVYLLED